MKRGMIRWCFSCGELGTTGIHLQLSIPHWDAPPPASPSLEDLNLRFWPPNTGQKPTIQRDIIPLCPEKPFLSPKSSSPSKAPRYHPPALPSPGWFLNGRASAPLPSSSSLPPPAHFPGPSPLFKPALPPRRLQINTPCSYFTAVPQPFVSPASRMT